MDTTTGPAIGATVQGSNRRDRKERRAKADGPSQRRRRSVPLPQLLAKAVEFDPAAVAISYEGRQLTYSELDAKSSRLARLLITRGVGPEDLVAIGIPRSLESVLAVWAVAKTGAGFVPIDPNYPVSRTAHMVADSGVTLGLTVATAIDDLPAHVDWFTLGTAEIDAELAALSAEPVSYVDRVRPLRAENPAYVIYTSGSTGVPKGVVVTHAGLANFCAEQVDRYHLTAQSRTLHFASPSFDASVLELLLAVGAGATMVVAPPEIYGGAELASLIAAEGVTHAFITPAALASIDPEGLETLGVVVVGGEACPPELVNRWAPGRAFHNGYGPTETTIMTNISDPLQPGAPITIGAGIRNMSAHVLDGRLRRVPTGVAGELYLSGVQLARGYHSGARMTAERFVANPYSADPGDRLYRTGDIVRLRDSGAVEFVGRNDSQVKIRGFRIELGEIDAVLAAHADVAFATTIGHRTASGTTILASYVLPVTGRELCPGDLAAELSRALPAHMVPAAVTVLERIPLTPVGKIDRGALPVPVLETKAYVAPASAMEEIVAEVFGQVLALERVGRDDDFFELGGNSLVATQVAARLSAALDARIPARIVFESSTVHALAAEAEKRKGEGARLALVAGYRPARPPLSYAQQRYWFLNQFDTDSAVDNIPFAVRLSGPLDRAALQAALGDLIARHETLRTLYPTDKDGPYQVILPADSPVPDLSPVPIAAEQLEERILDVALRGFDVTTEVPLHVMLFELGTDEHVLAVVVHHIAADGSSMLPFARDLAAAYAARAAGSVPAVAPLEVQYADYALWQRELLGSDNDPQSLVAQQIAFWKAELSGVPDHIELPTDRPRPAVQSFRGASTDLTLDASTHHEILALARASGATPFMVLHAALAVLIARLSGADDIVVGTPVAGRGERELDDMIGMFVNTLVMRTRVHDDESFDALLRRVREADLQAYANADVPFERLVEVLNPPRSVSRNPLFQIGFSFQNMSTRPFELPGLQVAAVEFDAQLAKTDLQISIVDQHDENGDPGPILIEFGYATDLFDESSVRTFARRYERIIRGVLTDPAAIVGDVDILDAAERPRLLADWNTTDHAVEPGQTLVSLFDAAVAAAPGALAIVADDAAGGLTELTYAELDARINRLARHLVSLGVGPERLVVLAMERSVDLVVAMYAVVKAGGAYVPVDVDHPAARIAHIFETARPVCVLTTARGGLPIASDVPVVAVDTLELSGVSAHPITATERRGELRASNTAYVIFTSGSTGRPKGVAVSHGAITNQLLWKRAEYTLGGEDAVLVKTSATFDLSVWEFWSPLVSGARMVIASPDGHRDPSYLNALLERARVSTLHVVPSMLDALLTDADGELTPALRRVLVIGEALPADTAQRFRRGNTAELVNLYGPTETAVSVTAHTVCAANTTSVPIGVPEWNTAVYVLDSRLHPVPVGVPGELYLAGTQLARGYFDRPGLTAERFVGNPYGAPGTRLYRTGDLVVWNRDGELEYLCRTDFQVKVRGFRVELGEVEAALLRQHDIAQVAVVARADEHVGNQLIGYVVAADGASVDPADLRSTLARELPSYMVPSASMVVDEIPRSSNGKLDVRALPAPVVEPRKYRAPRTPVERTIADVFEEVLGIERIGLDDNFFELGGHSLLAARASAILRYDLGTTVLLPWFFTDPTVEQLAWRLTQPEISNADADAALRPIVHVGRGNSADPLFCVHPLSGLGWSYRELARYVDSSRPIYALQTPAILEADFAAPSIHALAVRYVDEIRRVQTEGHYRLLGWSLGGVIAHAMAAELQAQGQSVSLTLVDSEPAIDAAVVRSELVATLRSTGVQIAADADPTTLTVGEAQEMVEVFGGASARLTGERLQRMIAAAMRSAELTRTYKPAQFDGDIRFFGAEHGGIDGVRAWGPYVQGRIQTTQVPATHAEMMAPAALAVLGPDLERWLAREPVTTAHA